jgi:hypothetical protein
VEESSIVLIFGSVPYLPRRTEANRETSGTLVGVWADLGARGSVVG